MKGSRKCGLKINKIVGNTHVYVSMKFTRSRDMFIGGSGAKEVSLRDIMSGPELYRIKPMSTPFWPPRITLDARPLKGPKELNEEEVELFRITQDFGIELLVMSGKYIETKLFRSRKILSYGVVYPPQNNDHRVKVLEKSKKEKVAIRKEWIRQLLGEAIKLGRYKYEEELEI